MSASWRYHHSGTTRNVLLNRLAKAILDGRSVGGELADVKRTNYRYFWKGELSERQERALIADAGKVAERLITWQLQTGLRA
jgi:hypothetical protein